MAKKKDAERVDAPETQEPVEQVEIENFSLTPLELSQIQLHQARMQLQINLIEKLKLNMEMLAIKYRQDHAVLQGSVKGADDSRMSSQRDYMIQRENIEKRLGIKLDNYVLDDLTGTLRKSEDLE